MSEWWAGDVPPSMTQELSFICPRCGAESYHPKDIEEGYCGRCHWWTGDPVLGKLNPD